MSTYQNLKTAFAGESQANRKYLAFARKAEQEKLSMVSRLYKAIAAAETIHALKHLEIMNGIGSTEDNLKEAAQGEHYEFTEMKPNRKATSRPASPSTLPTRLKRRIMISTSKPCKQ